MILKKRGVMKNYEGNNKQFGSLHGQAEDPSFIISFPRAFGKVCVTKLLFFFPPPPQLSAEVLLSKAYNLQLLRRCCFEVDRVKRRFSGVSSSNCANVKRGNKKKNIFKKGGLQSVQ